VTLDQVAKNALRYRLLRDYLLSNGFVVFQKTDGNADPFVIDSDFYGETFEDAVDSLPRSLGCVIEFRRKP
jgi:hypothetical protein